ncbi:MAG: NUDIX hydrolase [Desulfobacteraceae bacterium]|nr:NUDIX hydrolase [Desulfobacteraceae bacterium]
MKINSIKKITDHNHLNLFSVQYKDRANQAKEWIFASRSNPANPPEQDDRIADAVVIIPYHKKEKKLVLIKEFRVVLGDYQYGFPAGLVDKGESVEDAGKRELFEETGLTMTRIIDQSPAVFSSSGMTDESLCLMFAECEGTPFTGYNEASEDIEVLMVSPSMALDILGNKQIKFDVKTWIVLNSFAVRGTL